MVTLSSCLIWQIISCILPPNEYGCIYAWTTLGGGPAIDYVIISLISLPNEYGCVYALLSEPAIDLQKMPILAKKNNLFRWSSFWYWRVCKQSKLSHLGHRKLAGIHWKVDAHKMSHYLVRILVQRHTLATYIAAAI